LGGATRASSKLNIAGIGFGGQGGHDLAQMESENIVALCRCDKKSRRAHFQKISQAKPVQTIIARCDEMKGSMRW